MSEQQIEERIQLNSTVSVTKAQLDGILAINKDWPYPANRDGWMLVHDAIRLDMSNFAEALVTMMAGLKNGAALEQWQVSNAKKFYVVMHDFIHHHHDMEETIFFPWMKTKTDIGERMSADHQTLMKLMDRCLDQVKALKCSGKADVDLKAVEALQASFKEMSTEMRDHFGDEEVRGLPLMRMHFTHQELLPIEDQLKKHTGPRDLAHLLNSLEGPAKAEVMTQFGIPGLIQFLVFGPAIKGHEKKVQRLVDELKAGQRAPRGCFGG